MIIIIIICFAPTESHDFVFNSMLLIFCLFYLNRYIFNSFWNNNTRIYRKQITLTFLLAQVPETENIYRNIYLMLKLYNKMYLYLLYISSSLLTIISILKQLTAVNTLFEETSTLALHPLHIYDRFFDLEMCFYIASYRSKSSTSAQCCPQQILLR